MTEPGGIGEGAFERPPNPTVDLVERARMLGLRDPYTSNLPEDNIPGLVVGAVVRDFERGRRDTQPDDQSYRLAELTIRPTGGYAGDIGPSYVLAPPPDSSLPELSLEPAHRGDAEKIRIRTPDGEFDSKTYPDGKQAFLQRVLDAYQRLKDSGIHAPDGLPVVLVLEPGTRGVNEEMSTSFAEKFPRSASLVTDEVRSAALEVEATRQEEEEETWLQEIQEKWGEESNTKFLLATLQTYADKRDKNRAKATMKSLFRRSVQALLWQRDADGKVTPGPFLASENLRLLGRLVGKYTVDGLLRQDNPRFAEGSLEDIERTLRFISVVKDSTTGKEAINVAPSDQQGNYERNGPIFSLVDIYGATREHSVARESDGSLTIRPDNDTTFTNLNVTLAPELSVDAELLDKDGNPTGRTITAEPILRARLTEEVTGKGAEQTTVYRTREGLVVICPGGEATCYPDDLSQRVSVTRKPVIYLYPIQQTEVTVKLDYAGTLTNTYPQINNDTWQVTAIPDGTLKTKGKKYKYLFWDGINDQIDWDWSEGFCVQRDEIDSFLEEKIEQLGLNFAEAQDFITYWSPMMKQNEWSLVSFQTEKYEALAKLMIDPKPDTLIRVFMVFKSVDAKVAITEPKVTKIKREGFTVVEWGGSNLDEQNMRTGTKVLLV